MLKPEAMQRTLIVSSKGHQAKVIETLHDLRSVHFIDFSNERGGAFEGFRLGEPLAEGEAASEHLIRIRALLRQLDLEGKEPQRALAALDVEARLESQLGEVERAVTGTIEVRETARAQLAEGREVEAKLQPLRALPLRLDDYRGYDSLTVFVGRADVARLEAELGSLKAREHLLVKGDDMFALFVEKKDASAFQEALYRVGYTDVEVPEGKGSPDERIREIQSGRASLEAQARQADEQVKRLAEQHRDFLLAAEEHLSIIVEKAEAPLSFASTENAFVVDAWVPTVDVQKVRQALDAATGGNVHIELLESGSAHGHGHGAHADAGFDAEPEASSHDQAIAPPTKYANGKAIGRFEWFTNLFSTPRYDEIDPTAVFAVFFPLFFGFMIGDLGLGLIMIGLGLLLIKKLPKVDGMKQLGTAVVVAGIIASVFGGFVFKDALGIPLGMTHHTDELLAEQGIAAACTPTVYKAIHETTWGCLLGMGPVHAEPIVYKVTDVNTMLLISVGAALVHLLIGLLFGIRNELGHGAKHVTAKVAYLVLLLTFFPAVLALLSPGTLASVGLQVTQGYMIAGGGFVVGAIMLGWAEGFAGILEIPSMFSAIMSYLRLGAVAIAKGAMAIAFNNLTLVAALSGGGIIVVLGLIGFVLAQVVLFVLGMLSGAIQALRLNFVEFFTKFYKGGGKPFKPFGRERQHTTLSPSTP